MGKTKTYQEIKMKIDDALLNTDEAAAFLDIQPTTLEIWRCTKRYNLEYVKVGRLVRYRQSALVKFLANRTVNA